MAITYRNEWLSPTEDERWEGLLQIADGIYAAHGAFSQSPQVKLTAQWMKVSKQMLSPLELAALLQRVVDRIREMTRANGY